MPARVPYYHKTEKGYRLGQWVGVQRASKETLSADRIARLESLSGWVWDAINELWEEGYSELLAFVELEGHAKVPLRFKTADGYKIGRWVSSQRRNKDKMSAERKARLEAVPDWVWDPVNELWEEAYTELQAFVEREGHARVPTKYKTEEDYKLGSWVSMQRTYKDKLSNDRVARLESLPGWVWSAKKRMSA